MLFHRCLEIRISSPFHLDTLNISIQNTKFPENAKNECPDIIFPPPFFVKLELCRLCMMSMPNTICADRQCYPWIILLCAVLCAVICDKSWKWTESFIISFPKHELPGSLKKDTLGLIIMFAFFGLSGHLIFRIGMFKVSRWNGLEILIPKHLWKSIIGPLEQI